ncbi:MAG: malate dehydrogenase [Limosilactobacillus sp.]|uniref:lactate/malate family dehydrogenase n=1 Tax=Limosilactobacillus sp. TaxID=2773925 RepID=UPI0026FC3854|nr:malate dehydrogenase [Limosilactobacillus sp.]
MRTIGIIGLGHVGRLLAHHLIATASVDKLVLIDQHDDLAVGVQADLDDASTALLSQPEIIIQDYAALQDSQVLVIAIDGGDDNLIKTGRSIMDIARRVKSSGFHGIVINLTDPNEAVAGFLQEQLALPSKQVIGIGTVLDTARMRRAVANVAQVSPAAVSGFVYGQHGHNKSFAWSTVHVNGQPIEETINGHKLDSSQLAIQADLDGWYTEKGLGYNADAVVSWTARIISAIQTDEQLALPIAIFQPQYSTYVGFPALIGRHGVGNFILCHLLPVEEMAVKTAADEIQQQLSYLRELEGQE